jgi:ribose transport system ATP-binding protein
VLSGADLEVSAGEIRALVGRNGSGKSTLVKILAGYHSPDPGTSMEIGGVSVRLPLPPGESHRHGAAFVHQDLAVIPSMSVIDNLFVGMFETRAAGRIPWGRMRSRAVDTLGLLGLECSPATLVASLGQADRALLAIARALVALQQPGDRRGGGLLVLDEPTASLPQQDVQRLFAAIREVAAQGTGIIYVSHRLTEVFALADSVSVLRDGQMVATEAVDDLDEEQLIETMIGRRVDAYYPDLAPARGQTVLAASELSGAGVRSFSLDLRRGEVVGITGLNGAGHDDIPYLLFGAKRATGGTINVDSVTRPAREVTPISAMRSGIALLPADRHGTSGAQETRVRENLSLPILDRFWSRGRLGSSAERDAIDRLLVSYSVTPPDGRLFLRQLSGGNQQKALLAKWMQLEPDVLLLHEPTQGVDVTSKHEIFGRIERAAADGAAVLIASAEAEDLAHLCHRVIVLRDGRIGAELAGTGLTSDQITEHALRSEPVSVAAFQNGEQT